MDHGTREETGLPGGRLRDEKPVFFGLGFIFGYILSKNNCVHNNP